MWNSRYREIYDELIDELNLFGPRKNMPWRSEPLALAMHERRLKEIRNEI